MLTLHTTALLLPGDGETIAGGAVLVDGDRIAALGTAQALRAEHPAARVRHWPGALTPGLRQRHATWLLTGCYFPDPREAAELGELPLFGPALDALALDAPRRAGSVRRGLQQMLRRGTTAVAVDPGHPLLAPAVSRVGLLTYRAAVGTDGPPGIAVLDPLSGVRTLAEAIAGPLEVGARADLAAFDAPDEAALLTGGGNTCLATVLGGRLVYRAR
ncbi:hypothetical protein [Streptomyces sp. NPDC006879]|uniref:imidazolonepropionase-like domain-containing protein n=1 Tax=Streptomyces sp. NPDC006879 TaxID=3364767 RepID=UPI003698EA00